MNESVLGQLAATFAAVSFVAIGGANATVPEIHRQVVEVLHWMDDATFANLVAIAQTAPGPNLLVVSMIGWQMAGGIGLLVATVSVLAPSSLIAFAAGRTMHRFSTHSAVAIGKRALAPIAVGLMLASGLVTAKAADHGGLTVAITAGVTFLIVLTRASPLWGIAAGAILGVLGAQFDVLS